MNLDFNAFLGNPAAFFWNEFISALMNLDISAIAIAGIIVIILFAWAILLLEFFTWLFSLLKRFLLFALVFASIAAFSMRFLAGLFMQQNYLFITVGAIGLAFAIAAIIVSLLSILQQWNKARGLEISKIKEEMREALEEELKEELMKRAKVTPPIARRRRPNLKHILERFDENSFLAVLSYVAVLEFGIFSSPVPQLPGIAIGLILFIAFIFAALLFIKTSYEDQSVGVKHLAIAAGFGMFLSIVLGYAWNNIPLATLLSPEYFATNSLVAFIAGLAVSLLMGSKG